jgi:hypothetical protein
MIEPNPSLNDSSPSSDPFWTPNSLRIYMDTRMEALKELKAHDLRAFHERVDAVEARVGQFEVTRQAVVDEVDRRLVERQDIQTAFIKESMANGFRSVDDRFRLAKEFNEQISKAATDSLGIALTASNEAVKKAEQAVEKRFDSVNEFRQSLSDLSNQMIQRTEAVTMVGAANEKIDNIGSRLDRMTGADHKGQTSTTTTISAAAVIIAAIVGAIAFLSFERTTTPMPIYVSPSPSHQ